MSGRRYSDQELLEEFRRLTHELGHTPTVPEINEYAMCSHMTYVRRFETLTNAAEEADIDPNNVGRPKIPTEDLLDEIRRLVDDLGRIPTLDDMIQHGEYAPSTYGDHFPSWSAAKYQALAQPARADGGDGVDGQ